MEDEAGGPDAIYGAVLRRRGPGWATFAALFVAFVVGIVMAGSWESFWPLVLPTVAGFALVVRSLFGAPRLLKGNVDVTADHFEVGGLRLTRRALIEDAHVVPGAEKNTAHVCLRRRWGMPPIDVHVGSIANGRRLLHALGMDPRQKTQTFAVYATSQRHFMLRHLLFTAFAASLIAFVIGVFNYPVHARLALCLFGAIAVSFTVERLINPHVTVGSDGVLLKARFGRRFIPIGDIVRVKHKSTTIGERVNLTLQSGKVVSIVVGIPVNTYRYRHDDDALRLRAVTLAERIRETILDRKAHAAEGIRLPERAGRTGAEWLVDLKNVAKRAGYRNEAAPDEAALFRVAEDPAKNAALRAAAGVALAPGLDDDGKRRLRTAAEASAAPKLRVALTAAADNDEPALAEALEGLDDESAPPVSRSASER